MFRISRFHEFLQPVSRGQFDRWVRECEADKHRKGFSCWNQLVAMIYAQLSGASSLRQLEAGYNSQSAHHYHLGVNTVRRSTLADANANGQRSCAVFTRLAQALMAQASRKLRAQTKQMLYLLDSTSITLKGRGFDAWTAQSRTRNTQGMKWHMLYEANRQIPQAHSVTAPNVNDIDEAQNLPIEPGARYVFDKGYCHYSWWAQLDARGADFVTRFKTNAALKVHDTLPIPDEDTDVVLKDELVVFHHRNTSARRRNHYTRPLRRIVVSRPDKGTPLVLATNDLLSPAREIAEQYKARWQVELYFKWLKQHLRIRQFLGRKEHAVRIQILTALITYLLLALCRERTGSKKSLWVFLGELRSTLFQRTATEVYLYRARRDRQRLQAAVQPRLFQ